MGQVGQQDRVFYRLRKSSKSSRLKPKPKPPSTRNKKRTYQRAKLAVYRPASQSNPNNANPPSCIKINCDLRKFINDSNANPFVQPHNFNNNNPPPPPPPPPQAPKNNDDDDDDDSDDSADV